MPCLPLAVFHPFAATAYFCSCTITGSPVGVVRPPRGEVFDAAHPTAPCDAPLMHHRVLHELLREQDATLGRADAALASYFTDIPSEGPVQPAAAAGGPFPKLLRARTKPTYGAPKPRRATASAPVGARVIRAPLRNVDPVRASCGLDTLAAPLRPTALAHGPRPTLAQALSGAADALALEARTEFAEEEVARLASVAARMGFDLAPRHTPAAVASPVPVAAPCAPFPASPVAPPELPALEEALAALADVPDTDAELEVLLMLRDHAQAATAAQTAALYVAEPAGGAFAMYAAGAPPVRVAAAACIAGRAAEGRDPLSLPDVARGVAALGLALDPITEHVSALLCMPVVCEGHVIAVVQVHDKRGAAGAAAPAMFDARDEAALRVFAAAGGVAARLSRLRASGRRGTATVGVARALLAPCPDERTAEVLTHSQACTGAAWVGWFVVDRRRQELEAWTRSVDAPGPPPVRVPLGCGFAGHVVATGAPLAAADAQQHARYDRGLDLLTGCHTQTVLAVPVVYDGAVVGVLQAANKRRARGAGVLPFTAADAEALKGLADVVGLGHAIELQAGHRAQLAVVSAVGDSLAGRGTEDPAPVLRMLVEQAARLAGAAEGTLWLVDRDAGVLEAAYGDCAGPAQRPLDAGLAGWVAAVGRTAHVDDPGADPRCDPGVDAPGAGLLCVVLRGECAEAVAVLQLAAAAGGRFSTAAVDAASVCAAQAEAVLRHAALRGIAQRDAACEEAMVEVAARTLAPDVEPRSVLLFGCGRGFGDVSERLVLQRGGGMGSPAGEDMPLCCRESPAYRLSMTLGIRGFRSDQEEFDPTELGALLPSSRRDRG